MSVAGFVLAGGQSSRMGQNKARLPLNYRPLVEAIATRVLAAVGNVALVGNPQAFADLPFECLPDLHPGLGPLAGLETALASKRAEWNLAVACDMPDLSPAALAGLVVLSQQTDALCVITTDSIGRKHPLCAMYRSASLPFVEAAIKGQRLRLLDLVKELKAVEFQIDAVLINVNTPEQWANWRQAQSNR